MLNSDNPLRSTRPITLGHWKLKINQNKSFRERKICVSNKLSLSITFYFSALRESRELGTWNAHKCPNFDRCHRTCNIPTKYIYLLHEINDKHNCRSLLVSYTMILISWHQGINARFKDIDCTIIDFLSFVNVKWEIQHKTRVIKNTPFVRDYHCYV